MPSPSPVIKRLIDLRIPSAYHARLEALAGFLGSFDDLLSALSGDADKLAEAVSDLAASDVSVYTMDRFEWAASHPEEIAQYENDALNSSSSIEDAIAFCWQEAEREDYASAASRLSSALEGVTGTR